MSPECQVLRQENLTLMVDKRMYGEPFDVTCNICGEPLLPNLSQADVDGCLWICINPDCPELCAGELETEDLVEGGGAAAPPLAGSRERAQADLALLRRQVRELRRRSALAAAAAAQLSLALAVSYRSDDYDEAQGTQRLLAAAAALCGAARHAAADAEECLAGIDPELPGLLTSGEL